MTFWKAKEIYKKIAKANGIFFRPVLLPWWWDESINAASSILFIKVNKGAYNTYNDDELALTIGHELAHWKLGHVLSFKKSHDQEFMSDKLGAEYATKAGYNMLNALSKFKLLNQRETASHPHPKKRYQALYNIYKV